jgi:hypothetical protein
VCPADYTHAGAAGNVRARYPLIALAIGWHQIFTGHLLHWCLGFKAVVPDENAVHAGIRFLELSIEGADGMAKILAMGAYLYQAALAFGLLIVVARLLAPSDYASYSLFISISQFGAIALFEWIRFGCSRFYPGLTDESEAIQRRAITLEFSFCTLACLGIALATAAFGMPLWIALIGGAVGIFQGGSDLLARIASISSALRAQEKRPAFSAPAFVMRDRNSASSITESIACCRSASLVGSK